MFYPEVSQFPEGTFMEAESGSKFRGMEAGGNGKFVLTDD